MIKHVAFDFDGTLADSVEFCLAVFDRVFRKYIRLKARPDRRGPHLFAMRMPRLLKDS